MKKNMLIIIIGYALILILTVVFTVLSGQNYTYYVMNPFDSKQVTVTIDDDSIVKTTSVDKIEGYTVVNFKSLNQGKTETIIKIISEDNPNDYTMARANVYVLPTGVIYLTGYDFGGFQFLILGISLLTLFSACLLFKQFLFRKKTQYFSYKTVLDLALSVFFLLEGLIYLALFFVHNIFPVEADSWVVFNMAGIANSLIFACSLPIITLFAVFMSVSNLSLIRHEGLRKNNLYGIFISALMLIGSALCVYFIYKQPTVTNLQNTQFKDYFLNVVFSTGFVYYECILFATQFCTLYASRHKPKFNQDFIVILGCKIRDDGTPKPLLRGRIDNAIRFYNEQLEANGREAKFIPSGGKGDDEIISEAQSMKNYLIEAGIDENIIFTEDRSTSTLENMKFSKEISDNIKTDSNILFSTTNYHVFRSGILSAKAGLKADGIGAKTKWYFWPNAQIREFIGLIYEEWRINFLFVIAILAFSLLFSNITGIIDFFVK